MWQIGTTKGSSTSNDCSYDTRYIRGRRPKMGQVSSNMADCPLSVHVAFCAPATALKPLPHAANERLTRFSCLTARRSMVRHA